MSGIHWSDVSSVIIGPDVSAVVAVVVDVDVGEVLLPVS